jgi:hypothetical protein
MNRQTRLPPPAIDKIVPVTNPLLIRKRTPAATSSGRPIRHITEKSSNHP